MGIIEWRNVESQADADAFMTAFGSCHDACIREAHIWSEHWVDESLAMAISTDLDTKARLLLQRQWRPLSAVELLFAEVVRFSLASSPESYASEIFEATLLVRSEGVFWADIPNWRPEAPERDDATWIHARRLKWRDASDWMGSRLRYGPAENEAPAV